MRPDSFKQTGPRRPSLRLANCDSRIGCFSPCPGPWHCLLNPGQLWNSTALPSYLSELTRGQCDNSTHTQARAWGLPRIQPCRGGSWPESPIRVLQDTKEATVPATISHIPHGSLQVKTWPSAQNTRNRGRTTSLLFPPCPHKTLPFIFGLFQQ